MVFTIFTSKIENKIGLLKINQGIANKYMQGTTAAIMVQENWDNSVQKDVVDLLSKIYKRCLAVRQASWQC